MAIKERDERGKITKAEGGGRIKGARNLLQGECLSDILRHWRDGGYAAIDIVFKESPATYLKIVASILPKELLIEDGRKLESMSDDELDAHLAAIRRLQSVRLGESGGGAGGGEKQTLN